MTEDEDNDDTDEDQGEVCLSPASLAGPQVGVPASNNFIKVRKKSHTSNVNEVKINI